MCFVQLTFSNFSCHHDVCSAFGFVRRRPVGADDAGRRQQAGVAEELDDLDLQGVATVHLREAGKDVSDGRHGTGSADRELEGHSEEICEHFEAGKGAHLALLPRCPSPGT